MPLAAWRIANGKPVRLGSSPIALEKLLEGWIADDPGLVDPNLLVIQRQMHIEGGILDLLCVDLQGRATVVEIKRGKLIRETIAQALDYASSIAAISAETLKQQVSNYFNGKSPDHPGLNALLDDDGEAVREVAIVVVGVGVEPGLERMIDFLGSRHSVPIRAVSFDVFGLSGGEKLLVREETEPVTVKSEFIGSSVAAVIERAGGPDSEAGRRLVKLVNAAEQVGLHIKPYKWSVMFAPPEKKTRHLMTVWRWSKSKVGLQYSANAFAEFFPVSPEEVRQILGSNAEEKAILVPTDAEADEWVARLLKLFDVIARASEPQADADGPPAPGSAPQE